MTAELWNAEALHKTTSRSRKSSSLALFFLLVETPRRQEKLQTKRFEFACRRPSASSSREKNVFFFLHTIKGRLIAFNVERDGCVRCFD